MSSKIANCESIKDSFAEFLAASTTVLSVGQTCVLTLPVLSVDGRWADVFIERKLKNNLLVHDNGKASAEMFLQGVNMTGRIRREFELLARRYGVYFDSKSERFEALCKEDSANDLILRVAACSAVATRSLLDVVAIEEQECAVSHVRDFLEHWKRKHRSVGLSEREAFEGASKQHVFDFVLRALKKPPIVGVAVLSPTVSGLNTAERFGFKIQDLRATKAELKSIAVRTKPLNWSKDAVRVVERFADLVIKLDPAQRMLPTVEDDLNRMLGVA